MTDNNTSVNISSITKVEKYINEKSDDVKILIQNNEKGYPLEITISKDISAEFIYMLQNAINNVLNKTSTENRSVNIQDESFPGNVEFTETLLTQADRELIKKRFQYRSNIEEYLNDKKCIIKGTVIHQICDIFTASDSMEEPTYTRYKLTLAINNFPPVQIETANFNSVKFGQNVVFEFLKEKQELIDFYPADEQIEYLKYPIKNLTKNITNKQFENYRNYVSKEYNEPFFSVRMVGISAALAIPIFFLLGLIFKGNFNEENWLSFVVIAYIIVHNIRYLIKNNKKYSLLGEVDNNSILKIHQVTLIDKYIVSGDINGYRLLSDNSKYKCSSIQFSEANVGDYVEIAHTIDNIVVEIKVLKNRILRK